MKLNAIKSLVAVSSVALGASTVHAQLISGDTSDYAVLVNGSTSTFGMSSGTTIDGNVGVDTSNGNSPQVNLNQGVINGNIQFTGAYNQQNQHQPPNFSGTVNGTTSENIAEVGEVAGIINSISSEFGGAASTPLTIVLSGSQTQTVTADLGTLDTETINGVSESAYVYDVSAQNGFQFNGGTLVISGTSTQNVVINVENENGEFDGGITLSGGITANNVVFNLINSGEYQNADGGASQSGTFIIGEGNIENPITGHVFGGDGNGLTLTSGGEVIGVVAAPEPGTWMGGAFLMLPIIGSILKRFRKRTSPPSLPV